MDINREGRSRMICEQCGARGEGQRPCRRAFEALLAYENERPGVFASVHHLTVSCYCLQHPAGFAKEALVVWYDLLAWVTENEVPVYRLRRRMADRVSGLTAVMDSAAGMPAGWPTHWARTVVDVYDAEAEPPMPEEYVRRALDWALATREGLRARFSGASGWRFE